jgi:hypothetical protein
MRGVSRRVLLEKGKTSYRTNTLQLFLQFDVRGDMQKGLQEKPERVESRPNTGARQEPVQRRSWWRMFER